MNAIFWHDLNSLAPGSPHARFDGAVPILSSNAGARRRLSAELWISI
jgi:hypothetical protein